MLQMVTIERRDWLAMPSPGDLVSAMADALGLPEATLISHDRALSEAGLRTKGGRGRSAAQVTARDAAYLLVAVLGSAQIKDSAATIKRYAASRPRSADSSVSGFAKLGIAELGSLSDSSSFLDAIESLISAAANGSMRCVTAAERKACSPNVSRATLIELTAQTPGTVGVIRVAGAAGQKTASVIYALPDPFFPDDAPPPPAMLKAWQAQVEAHRTDTDLSQQRRVSGRTIVRLGALLARHGKDA